jgi:hypothetical protein
MGKRAKGETKDSRKSVLLFSFDPLLHSSLSSLAFSLKPVAYLLSSMLFSISVSISLLYLSSLSLSLSSIFILSFLIDVDS